MFERKEIAVYEYWPKALGVYAARIEAIAERANAMVGEAPFAVYAFIDITKPDPNERFTGSPIYVGETSNVFNTIIEHFKVAVPRGGIEGSLQRELARLADADALPAVQILSLCRSRKESRVAETLWAQTMLLAGYTLFNRLPRQSQIMGRSHRMHWEQRWRSASGQSGWAPLEW